jgi:hypothetical protein
MRFKNKPDMKAFFIAALLCAAFATAAAQSTPKASGASKPAAAAKKTPSAARTECVEAVGLCVAVPAMWQRLGDIFGDLGFVVAESHPGMDSATRPQISVAAIDVPSSKDGGNAPTLDALVDLVLTPDGTFTSAETQQRTRLLLNGSDAQILRVKLHDDATNADFVEEVALIEGYDGFVYSIALRCPEQDFTRLDPVFQKTAHSWHMKPPAPAPAQPIQDTNKK